jgi:translation initiation factor IF-1
MPVTSARAAKSGKGMSKTAARKVAINRRMTDAAMKGDLEESHSFAQITKLRGFCQMSIKLADGSEALAIVRGALRGGGPTRMKMGDIVLVETIMGEGGEGGGGAGAGAGKKMSNEPTHLIVGVLEAKQITTLRKEGAVPDWMTLTRDGEEEAAAAAAGRTYVLAGDEEDEEEIDVSKI